MAQVAKATFDRCLHKALRLQEERAMRPGRGSEQHWHLSAAVGLVGQQFDPSQSETVKLQLIDRISRLLYKMLALQEGPDKQSLASEVSRFLGCKSAAKLTKRQVFIEESSSTTIPVNGISNTTTEPLSAEGFTNAGLRLDAFDLGSTSEWMMDDFWFFNDVPPLGFNDPSIPAI